MVSQEAATDEVSVTSSGVIAGDNPIHHALLLLIIQVGIIIFVSRSLALIMRPLKQPRVVAEILGGILLGPTGFGKVPGFSKIIFPESSLVVLETVAEIGLIFFLFLVGLELNIKQIRRAGVMTAWIGAGGIVMPFGLGTVLAAAIYKFQLADLQSSFGAFALFLGVALSITAFAVLARILTERKLLNTEIGQVAMSAAALNDIVAWVLLALAVAISNSGSSPLIAVWVLLLGVAFVAFMFLVVSPIVHALAHRKGPPSEPVLAVTLMLVLGAAFLTDLIGIHVIFGAFVCGIIIPQESLLAATLTEKVEDLVTILFLPLYFAVSGLKTQFSAINNGNAVLILFLVIATACTGKVMGTFIVAKVWGVGSRKALALGFLMNTKGLVELIVLNIGLSKGVLDEQLFAIMVIMTVATTFMTTPIFMWLYAPARDIPPYKRRRIDCGDGVEGGLRMLLCPAGSWNVAAMINLMDIARGRDLNSLRGYVLHLIACSDRLSSIRKSVLAAAQDSRPEDSTDQESSELDAVEIAFRAYAQTRRVRVKTAVAISAFHSMHIDIVNAACSNRANFLLLSFHMRRGHDGSLETKVPGLEEVNRKVLQDPPCSVGLLVDTGFGHGAPVAVMSRTPETPPQHVYVLFFGGADDREALMLARRMLAHGGVKLTVIQFVVHALGRTSSQTLEIQTKLAATSAPGAWSAAKALGGDVIRFFAAPWLKNPSENPTHSDSSSTPNEMDRDVDAAASRPADGDGEFEARVAVDRMVSQRERSMDVQALAPIFATAARGDSDEVHTSANNAADAPSPSPSPWHAGSSSQSQRWCDSPTNLTLRVMETKDPAASVLEIVASAERNGLVIAGLHAQDSRSPITQAGAVFPVLEGHGLGPLGDYVMSLKSKSLPVQASLLVVKQHNPDHGCSSSACAVHCKL